MVLQPTPLIVDMAEKPTFYREALITALRVSDLIGKTARKTAFSTSKTEVTFNLITGSEG
jgi:hypothetical protein